MTIARTVGMLILAGVSALAKEKVPVYVQHASFVPEAVLSQAKGIAYGMLENVGVRIEWHGELSASRQLADQAIVIQMTTDTPKDFMPGAFAFASPYEGVHITVFWNRMTWAQAHSNLAPVLLAHVIVHEITHILEGVNRHSESGIMKQAWTAWDYSAMLLRPLPFAPLDVDLIHRGMATRARTRMVLGNLASNGATSAESRIRRMSQRPEP
jgi:hypothetical protein